LRYRELKYGFLFIIMGLAGRVVCEVMKSSIPLDCSSRPCLPCLSGSFVSSLMA